MPAQDRVRRDPAMAAQRSGQPPNERGEHGPVRPLSGGRAGRATRRRRPGCRPPGGEPGVHHTRPELPADRYPLAPQLLTDPAVIRCGARHRRRRRRREQRPLRRGVIQVGGQRPAQPDLRGPVQVAVHRGRRDPHRRGDLPLAQPTRMGQPQHFSDLSHGGSGPPSSTSLINGQSCPREADAPSPPRDSPCRRRAAPQRPESLLQKPGTAAPLPPERSLHLPRNRCSITSGGRSNGGASRWCGPVARLSRAG